MKSTFAATLQRRSIRTFVGADETPELLLTKPNGECLMQPLVLFQGLLSPQLRVVGTSVDKWFEKLKTKSSEVPPAGEETSLQEEGGGMASRDGNIPADGWLRSKARSAFSGVSNKILGPLV